MGTAVVTWPPPRPSETPIEGRPWDPKHRKERSLVDEADHLVYVVVDEVVDDWVGLSFAPWPIADDFGRLRFPGSTDPVEVGTSKRAVEAFLATPKGERVDVRIGMTFAARVKRGKAASLLERLSDHAAHGEVRIEDLNKIVTRPVHLTERGRRLAKLATYGAVLSTLPAEVEDDWRLADEIEQHKREADE